MSHLSQLGWLALASLLACSPVTPTPDAGPPPADAGPELPDAGVDAGLDARQAFRWSFETLGCEQAFVRSVNLVIADVTTAAGETFPCTDGGVEGGRFPTALPPGAQAVVARGLNAHGDVLYELTTTVTVPSEAPVSLVLPRTGRVGSAQLSWTFPAGEDCFQSGVDTVALSLDGVFMAMADCGAGFNASFVLPQVSWRDHVLYLEARDSSDADRFSAMGTISGAEPPRSFTFQLQ